jgi:hypothetical protein
MLLFIHKADELDFLTYRKFSFIPKNCRASRKENKKRAPQRALPIR